MEQFLKEEGNVDREENGDGLYLLHRHVRKYDVIGEISYWSVEWGNFESDKNSKFRAQEQVSKRY